MFQLFTIMDADHELLNQEEEVEMTEEQLEKARLKVLEEIEAQKLKNSELYYLVNQVYSCRECQTPMYEPGVGIDSRNPNHLKKEKLANCCLNRDKGENCCADRKVIHYCCHNKALFNAMPNDFPIDLIPLIGSYCNDQPSYSFLTTPPLIAQSLIRCYVRKEGKHFHLYLEQENHPEFQRLRVEDTPPELNGNDKDESMEHKDVENSSENEQLVVQPSVNSLDAEELNNNFQSPNEIESESSEQFDPALQYEKYFPNYPDLIPYNTSNNLKSYGKAYNKAIRELTKQTSKVIVSQGKDIFLMSAHSKSRFVGNSYLLSSAYLAGGQSILETSPHYLGKLESNLSGSDFIAYDQGTKIPEATQSWYCALFDKNKVFEKVRHEIAHIQYSHFYDHAGSPIRIQVLLPNSNFTEEAQIPIKGSLLKQMCYEANQIESGTASLAVPEQSLVDDNEAMPELDDNEAMPELDDNEAMPELDDNEDISEDIPEPPLAIDMEASNQSVLPPEVSCDDNPRSISKYKNVLPTWHDGMNAYVMHFDHYRVKEKSVKNFKIVENESEVKQGSKPRTLLQFGRTFDRNVFIMDYAYPFSAQSAFSVCLSSIANKLGV
jgi:hypothetical protein